MQTDLLQSGYRPRTVFRSRGAQAPKRALVTSGQPEALLPGRSRRICVKNANDLGRVFMFRRNGAHFELPDGGRGMIRFRLHDLDNLLRNVPAVKGYRRDPRSGCPGLY